ncbi:ester cyclase [Runella sp.]|jgi:hypothetical protein|uniref:ester cyclase n=1 Tax=Runella sp. TaxID=1960881 RepID=UPI00301B388A
MENLNGRLDWRFQKCDATDAANVLKVRFLQFFFDGFAYFCLKLKRNSIMKTNKEFIVEYCEALNGKPKPTELINCYISDADAELKGHIMIFEAGIPCYDFIPEDIITEGNKVMVRFTAGGKHTGDLFGCAPTGNDVKVSGIIVYEVADYLIVNHWMEMDSVGLMQQISAPKTQLA